MKAILLIASLLLIVSYAEAEVDCTVDPIDTIKEMKTCYEASMVAETCSMGSGFDVMTTDAAVQVCSAEYGGEAKLSESDKALLESMMNRCNEAYDRLEGSMYRSMAAYCRLNAAKFMNSVKMAEEL